MSKHVDPATTKTAFTCPHCGVFTKQFWHTVRTTALKDDEHPWFFPPDTDWEKVRHNLRSQNPNVTSDQVDALLQVWQRQANGDVFIAQQREDPYSYLVSNCHISRCWHCNRIAVWVHRHLVDPAMKQGGLPNPDMPDEIARDFDEARSILNLSPRGAAALLRLCVEKLCNHLGATGKTIDDKIANLISKGLDERVKDALDVVRVVGNNAVHDGKLDVRDNDPDLASQLLDLVNEIVAEMISKPNRLTALKAKIPQGTKEAIEKRDAKAKANGTGPSGPTPPHS